MSTALKILDLAEMIGNRFQIEDGHVTCKVYLRNLERQGTNARKILTLADEYHQLAGKHLELDYKNLASKAAMGAVADAILSEMSES